MRLELRSLLLCVVATACSTSRAAEPPERNPRTRAASQACECPSADLKTGERELLAALQREHDQLRRKQQMLDEREAVLARVEERLNTQLREALIEARRLENLLGLGESVVAAREMRVQVLTSTLRALSARKAAPILAQTRPELAVTLLQQLGPERAGELLARMDPAKAAELLERTAGNRNGARKKIGQAPPPLKSTPDSRPRPRRPKGNNMRNR